MVLLVSLFGIIFGLLTKFSFGRNLLLKYPKFFTMGFVSHEGPTEETMKNSKFAITFVGVGWPKEDDLAETTDQHTNLPSKKIVTRVSASNPGTNLFFSFYSFKIELSIENLFSPYFRIWCNCYSSVAISQDYFDRKRKTTIDWWCVASRCLFRKN